MRHFTPAYLILLLFCTNALWAQRDYAVRFAHGTEWFPENAASVLKNKISADETGYALRYVQFEDVLSAEQRAALERMDVRVLGYVSFAAYLLALPDQFDGPTLQSMRPRSVVALQPRWKMHRNLLEPPYGAWAVKGREVEISVRAYPFLSIRAAADLAAAKGATIVEMGQYNGYFLMRIDQDRIMEAAEWPFLEWLELKPEPGQKEDTNGRSLHRANLVDSDHPLGKKYNGAGVNTLTRDDGGVGPHIDFQGRLFNQPGVGDPLSGTHGDGVAGIIGGAGNLDPTKKGMAAGAGMYVIDYSSGFQDETLPLFLNENVTITNSSYSNGCNAGYTTAARTVDQQIFDYPTLMHVFSAGNSNNSDCGYGAGDQWGNITGGHKMAKNAIATANLNADGTLAGSSSRGPAHDGRLKPDIAAHGAGQNSTDPNHTYQVFGGTSAAAPGIAGCLAQLTQAYRTLHNTPNAPTALLKTAILNTANDLGNTGPDYKFGWGHVNNYRALRLLEENRYLTASIAHNATQTHSVQIPSGVRQAKLMLYWSDPEAPSNTAKALVNDLDLTVTGPGGVIYRPWKLNTAPNAALLDTPAGTGRDSLNNVEQVAINNPAAGAYTVTIKGFEVPQGPQGYYLAWEFLDEEVKITYPSGGEAMVPGRTEWIRWDAFGNTDPFSLRYSTDGGNTFTTIASPANNVRMFNWTVPNVTSGNVKLLLVRGSRRDTTDYPLTIAPMPTNLAVTRVCPDSVTLSWTKVNNATLAYDAFMLGEKYMELQTTTPANASSVKLAIDDPLAENWFSIRASRPDGLAGLRMNAIRWSGGLLACSQNFDIALSNVLSPATSNLISCGPVILPVTVKVVNNGLQLAVGATISYQMGAQQVTEPLPELAPGEVLDFTFATPLSFDQNGQLTLSISAQLSGDLLLSDNTLTRDFSVVTAPVNVPFTENFSATALPNGWSIENPDGLTTWTFAEVVGSAGVSSRVLRLNHYSYGNPSNQEDYLNVIPLDLSGMEQPWLGFDYTHAQYNSSYIDGLKIEVFPDCDPSGAPVTVWQKFDPELASLVTTSSYSPGQASQWRKDSVSLADYAGTKVFVRFTAVNGYGNNTYLDNIRLMDRTPPSAGFSTPAAYCAGAQQVLEALPSLGFNNQYAWSFGPGATPATAVGPGPHAVVFTGAVAEVRLVAANQVGSDTAFLSVPVSQAPVAAFAANPAGATVAFTNNSLHADTWTWDFGDGEGSDLSSPTHTYASEGVYTVTLTVQGPCGVSTATSEVTALLPPTAQFDIANAEGCAPWSVTMNNTSSPNAAGFEWFFPGGNPASSTEAQPVVSYDTPGAYSVTLRAYNAAGESVEEKTDIVLVRPLPSAAFTANANGLAIQLVNTTLYGNTYSWDFGDGNTSTALHPSHAYAADGTYTVTLTAENDCGTATFTETITVSTSPAAGFSASVAQGCAPLTVAFTNTSSANAQSFEWAFEGGVPATSGAPNPVVLFEQAGTYAVVLTVYNAVGSSTANATVTVGAAPAAGFTATVNGNVANFTNISTGADTYAWDFGDGGTATNDQPTHNYLDDGVYTVTLSATNACGTTQFSEQIVIATPPSAGFTAFNTQGCGPLEVVFTNTASANVSAWLWSFPGGTPASSTEPNPTVVYAQPGAYSVSLQVSNPQGSDWIEQSDLVVVGGHPQAGFDYQTAGNTLQLNNTSTGALAYQWDLGDGSTTTEVNPEHSYDQDGEYLVRLIAFSACGMDTFYQSVVIVTPPIAGFFVDVNQGCAPLSVTYVNTSSINAADFSWSFPGGTPSTSNEVSPVVTYAQAGVYGAVLTVSNQVGISSLEQTNIVTVEAAPVAAFAVDLQTSEIQFTNLSVNADTWFWQFGDGSVSTAQNPTYVYLSNGEYVVTLEASNACGTATFTDTILVETSGSAAPYLKAAGVALYPNPNQGQFVLDVTDWPGGLTGIELFQGLGQLVRRDIAQAPVGRWSKNLDYGRLPAGMYHLKLSTEGGFVVVKVLVN